MIGTVVNRPAAKISRRRFVQAVVAGGLSTAPLAKAWAGTSQASPVPTASTAQRPPQASKPPGLVYADNTLGDDGIVMNPAVAAFNSTEGVRASIVELGDAEYLQKVLAYYAAGQQMDTIYIWDAFLASWVQSGLIQPITKFPGVEGYLRDATEVALGGIQYKGNVWGLPQQGDVLVIYYHEGNFKKAGLVNPPRTWDELVQQCQKAQKAGFTYPIVWAAGQGDTHLPWQWYGQVWSRGAALFGADGIPKMDKGSIARETLQWWRDTFQTWKISDPRSAELRYIPHGKAFMAGKYVFGGLTFHYFMRPLNDPAQSSIAGQVKSFTMPGNGKSIGYMRSIGMVSGTKYREWAYELQQWFAGKRPNGRYETPKRMTSQLGYVPTYKQLFDDPDVRAIWNRFLSFDQMKKTVEAAVHYSEAVPVVYEPWFPEWQDVVNVQLQNCILGKTSADSACDAMAAKALELRRK